MRRFAAVVSLAAVLSLGAGCARITQPAAPSADVGADVKKLQGFWAIDTYDNGALDKRTPAQVERDRQDFERIRFRFDGNRLLITEGGREDLFATFTLDESKDPKVMVLTRGGPGGSGGGAATTASRGTGYVTARDKYPTTARYTPTTARGTFRGTSRGTDARGDAPSGPAEKWTWIYKFDGEKLVVALCPEDKKQTPTEFKPRLETPTAPGVVMFTFKRSAAAPAGGVGTARSTSRATYYGTGK